MGPCEASKPTGQLANSISKGESTELTGSGLHYQSPIKFDRIPMECSTVCRQSLSSFAAPLTFQFVVASRRLIVTDHKIQGHGLGRLLFASLKSFLSFGFSHYATASRSAEAFVNSGFSLTISDRSSRCCFRVRERLHLDLPWHFLRKPSARQHNKNNL